jgi:hypothetical protein
VRAATALLARDDVVIKSQLAADRGWPVTSFAELRNSETLSPQQPTWGNAGRWMDQLKMTLSGHRSVVHAAVAKLVTASVIYIFEPIGCCRMSRRRTCVGANFSVCSAARRRSGRSRLRRNSAFHDDRWSSG